MTFPSDIPIRLSRLSELTGEPLSTLQEATGELKALKKGRAWYVTLEGYRKWIESEGRRNGSEGWEEVAGDSHRRRSEGVWPPDHGQVKSPGTRKAKARKGKSGKALIFDISQKLDREKKPRPHNEKFVPDDLGDEDIG